MDSSQIILNWLLTKSKILNIKIVHNTWPYEFLDTLHHYTVEMYDTNKVLITAGHGVSLDSESHALLKATSELIERLAIEENYLLTSNGIACHPNRQLAKSFAKNELIERDAFMKSFYSHSAFKLVNKVERYLSKESRDLYKKLSQIGISQEFYQCPSYDNKMVVVYIAKGYPKHPFGLIVGSSYGKRNDFDHAFLEAVYDTLLAYKNRYELNTLSLQQFNSLKEYSPHDHYLLGLNVEYAKTFTSNYLQPNNYKKRNTKKCFFQGKELSCRLINDFNLPLYIYRFESDNLYNYAVGKPIIGDLPHCFS